MRLAKSRMMGCACIVRYRSISSERHRPSTRMVSESTCAHKRAMAPVVRKDQVLTSLAAKPMTEPKARTDAWRVMVASLDVT
jgi:hypothetical protein